ncbi:MAG: ATP-binding protein [Myxococcales bacterium]|nr:ATP-binding protein [Myxococcales bacterium]
MLPFSTSFLAELLALPREILAYEAGRRIATMRPGRFVLETDSGAFAIDNAVRDGAVLGGLTDSAHAQILTRYDEEEEELPRVAEVAVWDVLFEGWPIEVVLVTYPTGDCTESRHYVIAESRAVAEAFFTRVCAHASEVDGEILVFEAGSWRKDERLFAAATKTSLDTLVLRGSLRDDILDDVRSFFSSRAVYERYGVPYKRGILLYGPPGNGKTHFLKGLLGSLPETPCLYVKSLVASYRNDHEAIRRIFKRARTVAPCLLVFEDLDTLISDDNRSFFLNELDGFAENTGVVVLATTNYPERIDPAIIDRPSRFDRKYLFDLPSADERSTYLERWSAAVDPAMRLSEEAIRDLAKATHGFSFAYLKELTMSATMAWIRDKGDMTRVMRQVLSLMKEQAQSGRAPAASRAGKRVGLVPEA